VIGRERAGDFGIVVERREGTGEAGFVVFHRV
jgi:hypothetical protein